MSETVFDWEDSGGDTGAIDAGGGLWVNGERVFIETPGLARRIAAQFGLLAVHLEPLESAAANRKRRRSE